MSKGTFIQAYCISDFLFHSLEPKTSPISPIPVKATLARSASLKKRNSERRLNEINNTPIKTVSVWLYPSGQSQ